MQSFLANHQVTQVTQSSYSPDSVPCYHWLFPNLKSPLKGERFQTVDEIQENTMGQLMAIGRTVWLGELCAYFEGDRGVIEPCTMFSVSWSFFNKRLYFSYYMAGYLLYPRRLPECFTCIGSTFTMTCEEGAIIVPFYRWGKWARRLPLCLIPAFLIYGLRREIGLSHLWSLNEACIYTTPKSLSNFFYLGCNYTYLRFFSPSSFQVNAYWHIKAHKKYPPF